MLSIRLWVDLWLMAGPGPMPSCDMQTFRSVGDTLALQIGSGENWCLGRESHRGNNVVHTQPHTPMTNAFLKTGFIFVEHFAVPASPGWMTSKPISPCVVLNSWCPPGRAKLQPSQPPQKPTQTSRLQHSALLKPSAQAINAMGAGASSTLKTASDADVKMHINSLPKAMGNPVGFTWTWEFPQMISNWQDCCKMLPKKNVMDIEFARKKVPS